MTIQRWLRFLPGRSHLPLLVILVAVVVFAIGFVDLAVTKQGLQGRYERQAAKIERLREQNARLQESLDWEQEGQHVPYRAWQYFGKVPAGTGIIIVEPAPAAQPTPEAAPKSGSRPFWVDLWERLTRP